MEIEIATKEFRAHRTLLQLLADRGYGIPDEDQFATVEDMRTTVTQRKNGSGFNGMDKQYFKSDKKEEAEEQDPENKSVITAEVEDPEN